MNRQELVSRPPPYYGLRDYGGEENQIGQEQSPDEFIEQLVNVFKEVRNVLTDDGTCWVNLGDSYYNYRPEKDKDWLNKVSQIQTRPTRCVSSQRKSNRRTQRKRPYWNPMALLPLQ